MAELLSWDYRHQLLSVTVTEQGGGEPRTATATADVSVGKAVLEIFDQDSGQLVATSGGGGAAAAISARGTITTNQPNGKFIVMEPEEARRLRIVVRGTGADEEFLDVTAELLPGLAGEQKKTIRLVKNLSPEGKLSFRQDIAVGAPPSEGEPIPDDRRFPLLKSAETFSSVDLTAALGTNEQDSRRFISKQLERGRKQLGDAVKRPSGTPSTAFSEQIELDESTGVAALQAAGYQTLHVTFEGEEAWVRVKNQAAKLYLSGHGWHDQNSFADKPSFSTIKVSPTTKEADPDQKGIVLEDWDNNLDTVIFAGCSLLDIGNFNPNPKFKLDSPGNAWANVVRPETILLGYNDSAPEADENPQPGDDLRDTRVLEHFYGRIAAGDHPTLAWLHGNAQMENRIADHACAIVGDYYYFIRFNHARDRRGREAERAPSTNRQIWKVHRDWWTARNDFRDIPIGIGGKMKLRDLGDAVEGPGRNDAQ